MVVKIFTLKVGGACLIALRGIFAINLHVNLEFIKIYCMHFKIIAYRFTEFFTPCIAAEPHYEAIHIEQRSVGSNQSYEEIDLDDYYIQKGQYVKLFSSLKIT